MRTEKENSVSRVKIQGASEYKLVSYLRGNKRRRFLAWTIFFMLFVYVDYVSPQKISTYSIEKKKKCEM